MKNQDRRNHAALIAGKAILLLLAASLVIFGPQSASAIAVGQAVDNVTVRDASDNPATIPNLGVKTVLIFYVDPDVPDQNDPFTAELRKSKFPAEKFYGLGIVNLKDTIYPNSVVRMMVRKEMKANNAVILTDPARLLQKAWELGDCNNKSVIILIDTQRRVRFFKKGALTGEEIASTIALIASLVK